MWKPKRFSHGSQQELQKNLYTAIKNNEKTALETALKITKISDPAERREMGKWEPVLQDAVEYAALLGDDVGLCTLANFAYRNKYRLQYAKAEQAANQITQTPGEGGHTLAGLYCRMLAKTSQMGGGNCDDLELVDLGRSDNEATTTNEATTVDRCKGLNVPPRGLPSGVHPWMRRTCVASSERTIRTR